ncbi:MAG: DUF3276 family protein [Parcubacteria group bacterium]|jgi:hypothetical protein
MQQQNVPAQNMPEKVFSQMVKAGTKNYFFDVKKTIKGSNYLTIAESYKNQQGERVTNRVMLFKEHFPEFAGVLSEIKQYMQ